MIMKSKPTELGLTQWSKDFLKENASKSFIYNSVYDFEGKVFNLLAYELFDGNIVYEVPQIQMANFIMLALKDKNGKYLDKSSWNMIFTDTNVSFGSPLDDGY